MEAASVSASRLFLREGLMSNSADLLRRVRALALRRGINYAAHFIPLPGIQRGEEATATRQLQPDEKFKQNSVRDTHANFLQFFLLNIDAEKYAAATISSPWIKDPTLHSFSNVYSSTSGAV